MSARRAASWQEAAACRVQHELRTPVTIAWMALEALETAGPGSPELGRFHAMLRDALWGLKRHLDNLELLAGAAEPRGAREVELAALAAEAARELEPLAGARRVSVALELHARARVLASPELLKSAVRQLLDNAIRFNRPGGRAELGVRREAGRVELRVRDDGPGLSPLELERALQGLYQREDFLTRREGGLGIGLAVARRVAEAHGGRLTAETGPGRGSVFVLTLPEASHGA